MMETTSLSGWLNALLKPTPAPAAPAPAPQPAAAEPAPVVEPAPAASAVGLVPSGFSLADSLMSLRPSDPALLPGT